MSSRVCLALIAVSGLLLTGCAEVTSDHIIGEPGYGFWVRDTDTSLARPADTLFFDRAEKLEGVWLAGWLSEGDDQLYFVKHSGPATLEIAWTYWSGEGFVTTQTEAVVSTLDGREYLNMRPVYEEGLIDTTKYWPLHLWSGDEKAILMVADFELLKEALNDGTVEAVNDTTDESRIHVTGKASFDSYIGDYGRLAWDDVDVLFLRRIMDITED